MRSEGSSTTGDFTWQYRDGVLIVRLMAHQAVLTGHAAETASESLICLCEGIRGGDDGCGYLADAYLSGLLQGVLAGTRGRASLNLVGKYDG